MQSLIVRTFLLWVLVGFISIFIIKGTSIGEVIFTISAAHGWGIHTFDLLVFPIGFIALIISWIWYRNLNKNSPVSA